MGELLINGDVWKSFRRSSRKRIVGGHRDVHALVREMAETERRRDRGDAEKHGMQILRTPPEILLAFLKAWDEIAAEESGKNPFFKKVLDSQRAYASKVVPGETFLLPALLVAGELLRPPRRAPARRGHRRRPEEVALERSGRADRGAWPAPVFLLRLAEPRMAEPSPPAAVRHPNDRPVHRWTGNLVRGSRCRWCRRSPTR